MKWLGCSPLQFAFFINNEVGLRSFSKILGTQNGATQGTCFDDIHCLSVWNLLPEGGYGATPEYIEYGALCKLPSDKATLEAWCQIILWQWAHYKEVLQSSLPNTAQRNIKKRIVTNKNKAVWILCCFWEKKRQNLQGWKRIIKICRFIKKALTNKMECDRMNIVAMQREWRSVRVV